MGRSVLPSPIRVNQCFIRGFSFGSGYAGQCLSRGSSLQSPKVLQTLHQFRSTSAREHFPRAEREEYHSWPYNRIEKEHTFLAPRWRLRRGSPYYIRLFMELGELAENFFGNSECVLRADSEG
jgi:hypothetical protein